jgi:hypothetical protein
VTALDGARGRAANAVRKEFPVIEGTMPIAFDRSTEFMSSAAAADSNSAW